MPSNIRSLLVTLGFLVIPLVQAVNLDLQTLRALTNNNVFQESQSCQNFLATYVKGGNSTTGIANTQSDSETCGIGFLNSEESAKDAINSLDHKFLRSDVVPTVVDFGSPQKTVVVMGVLLEQPTIEKAINKTVWGSDNNNIENFPHGWTMATLSAIWKKGFQEPSQCIPGPNSDDFSAQYTFPQKGFRYIALYANGSISIFKTPDHQSWHEENDADKNKSGWQSHDEASDAVLAPLCTNNIKANAGEDKQGAVGTKLCFNSSYSIAFLNGEIINRGWDIDENGTIDSSDEELCIVCNSVRTGKLHLYITDQCGCVDTDEVAYTCVKEDKPTINNPPPSRPASAFPSNRSDTRDRSDYADEGMSVGNIHNINDDDLEETSSESDENNEDEIASLPEYPKIRDNDEPKMVPYVPNRNTILDNGPDTDTNTEIESGMSFENPPVNNYGPAKVSTLITSGLADPIFPSVFPRSCSTTMSNGNLFFILLLPALLRARAFFRKRKI